MKVEDIKFQSAQHVLDEIYNMNVKGGSPFGRAAAWAYKLACEQEALDSFDALEARMQELSDKLHKLKPTMATIRNSSVFARGAFDCAKKSGATLEETKAQIIATCDRIIESSYAAVDALAKNGANLITEGCTVMMHSYSSALMAVFTAAREPGQELLPHLHGVPSAARVPPCRQGAAQHRRARDLHHGRGDLGIHAARRPYHHGR